MGSTDSLCTIDAGPDFSSRLFPSYGSTVYSSLGDRGDATEFLRTIAFSQCPEALTGRTSSSRARDISTCDVVGVGADYFYIPGRDSLYILMHPIQMPVLIALSILTIYMTVVLAHNLEFSIKEQKAGTQPMGKNVVSLLAMTTLLLLTLFPNGNELSSVLEPFVTVEDQCAFATLTLYVTFNILRIFFKMCDKSWSSTDNNPVNLILGLLALTSMRFYTTADNVYISIITFMMSCRLMYKTNKSLSKGIELPVNNMVADTIIVSILTYVGIMPQYSYDSTKVMLVCLQALCMSLFITKLSTHMNER